MPTIDDYVDAAMKRIADWCNQSGVIMPPIAWTAVQAELKTMIEVGGRFAQLPDPTKVGGNYGQRA